MGDRLVRDSALNRMLDRVVEVRLYDLGKNCLILLRP
jgi:hypothetical protein